MTDKISQGEQLFAQGDIEGAEKLFQELLADEDASNPDIFNNLGVISFHKNEFEYARNYFYRTLELDPQNITARKNLADLCIAQEKFAEAATHLEEYVRIDEADFEVLKQLGMIYLQMQDQEKAAQFLNKSYKINPDQSDVKNCLVQLQGQGAVKEDIDKQKTRYKSAFAEVDITPKVTETNPIYLQGMAGGPRKASHIQTHLKMQLLLLEDENYTKILFISADIFGFGPEIVDPIRELVKPWGIEPEGLILNASHNHYVPGTISHANPELGAFYPKYAEQIVKLIEQRLPILYDNLEDCSIFVGETKAQIGVNRRQSKENKVVFGPNPEGVYDTHTPFLVIQSKSSKKRIFVVNHGCHPTGLGNQSFISAEFPGYLRQALTENQIAHGVMFLQGAAGSSKQALLDQESCPFCQDQDRVQQNGLYLAQKVVEAVQNQELQSVSGSFACFIKPINLGLERPPSQEELQNIVVNANTNKLVQKWASGLMYKEISESIDCELGFLFIGEKIGFLTLPGEPVAELSQKLKNGLQKEGVKPFVLGYTNGLLSYIPTKELIRQGGYEVEAAPIVYNLPSQFTETIEEKILQSSQNVLNDLKTFDAPICYGRYHKTSNEKRAFFVLSSGRCGTMTLAHLLDLADNATVWHHPRPYLIQETLQAYHNTIDKSDTFWRARGSLIYKTWAEGKIYGETDHNMTPFAKVIAEEIPEAKFIVLVRDPRDFVRSGMRRNYYYGHPWDEGRLCPDLNHADYEKWSSMSQFEKVCWLWNETYSYILNYIQGLPDYRYLIVPFEKLISDSEYINQIFNFLNINSLDQDVTNRILNQKLNAQPTNSASSYNEFTHKQIDTLNEYCGQTAQQFNYDLSYDKETIEEKPSFYVATHTTEPLVSIGLPVYNAENEVGKAIESILDQDYKNIELIISDNCSLDNTYEVCQKYAKLDKRIFLYKQPYNVGIYHNLGYVWCLARGKYICFAQHDNVLEKRFVSSCLQPLENDNTIALVYPKTRFFQNRNTFNVCTDNLYADSESRIQRYLNVINRLSICNAFLGIIRKDVFLSTWSFNLKMAYRANDHLFLSEIALLGKIHQHSEILLNRAKSDYKKSNNLEDHHAHVIEAIRPNSINDGITFPFIRLIYSHLEILNLYNFTKNEKEYLFTETIKCFKNRFAKQIDFEIYRAYKLIKNKYFFKSWGKQPHDLSCLGKNKTKNYHLSKLLKRLYEAKFIFPDSEMVSDMIEICREKFENDFEINSNDMVVKNL